MAIRLGGITWDVSINAASANKALALLDQNTDKLSNKLRSTTSLFGGLGNNLAIFNKGILKTQSELKDLNKELDNTGSAGTKASRGLKKTGASAKKASEEISPLKRSIASVAGAFGLAAGAFAGLAAALQTTKLITFAKDAALLAARVKNLGTVVQNVGKIAGFNASQINNFETSIKKLGITTRAARQGLAQLSQANIDLGQSAKLTRIAQDAAVIAGVDSSEAFNRLVVSIQRNDVRLLRNLGIVINLNSVYRKFSQETGRSVAQLTAFEKRQVLLNEVVQRGALIQGTYEKSLGDTFKQLTSLRRKVEEATVAVGKRFGPVLDKAVQTASKFFSEFEKGTAIIGPKGIALIITAAAAFGTLAVALGTVAVAIGALFLLNPAVLGIAAAIAAVSAVIAVGAVAYVNYKLSALEAAEANAELAKQARDTAQALVDAQPLIERLDGLLDDNAGTVFDNAARYKELESIAAELVLVFPDLADEIDGVVSSTDNARAAAKGLSDVLAKAFGKNVGDAEARIKETSKSIDGLKASLKDSVEATIIARKSLNAFARAGNRARSGFAFEAKLTKDLAKIRKDAAAEAAAFAEQDAEQALNSIRLQEILATDTKELSEDILSEIELKLGKLSNAGLKAQDVLIELGRVSLEETKKGFQAQIGFQNTLAQTQAALAQLEIRAFKQRTDRLQEFANRALQIQSQLETKERDRIKGTTTFALLRQTRLLEQLEGITLKSEEAMAKIRERVVEAKKAEVEREKKDKLAALETERERELSGLIEGSNARKKVVAEFSKKESEIKALAAKDLKRIIANADAEAQTSAEARTKILEGQRLAIKNTLAESSKAAEEERSNIAATADLQNGVIREIISLRKKEREELEANRLANVRALEEQANARKKLLALGRLDLAFDFRGEEKVGEEFLNGLDNATQAALVTFTAFNADVARLARERERIQAESAKKQGNIQAAADERKRKRDEREANRVISEFEKLLKEEEKLFRRRIAASEDGQAKLKLLTKKGIDNRIKQLEREAEKTESFIRKTQRNLDDAAAKGVGQLTSSIESFEKAIATASNAADIAKLKELFPKVVAENIKDATKALEDARTKLKEFDDVGLSERRAKSRDAIIAKEQELTAAGIKGRVFQDEIQRLERKQFLEAAKERKKLADEAAKQEKRQKALKEVAASGEDRISKAIAERTKLLDPESRQVGELVALKEESVRLAKEENTLIADRIRLIAEEKAALLGKFPDAKVGQEAKEEAEAKGQAAKEQRAAEAARLKRLGSGSPSTAEKPVPRSNAAEAKLADARDRDAIPLGPGQFKPKKRVGEPTPQAPAPKKNSAEAALLQDRADAKAAEALLAADAGSASDFSATKSKLVAAQKAVADKNAETADLLEEVAKQFSEGSVAAVADSFNSLVKDLVAGSSLGTKAFAKLRARR